MLNESINSILIPMTVVVIVLGLLVLVFNKGE